MCHASCLGLKALKFSETGLCEYSEVLWHWDKTGSPPVCVAPGTLPCQTLLRLTCLQSRVPVPIWHPRTPAPDPAAPPDTRHSQPTEDPRHCTLRYHQAPGRAGPSAQVLVLPGDTCSFSEQPQYPFAFPGGGTKDRAQHPKPILYRMEQGLLLQPGPHIHSNMSQKSHQETVTQSSSTLLRFAVPPLWTSLCCSISLKLCSNNNNSKTSI